MAKSMRARAALAAGLLACTFAFAACGGDDGDGAAAKSDGDGGGGKIGVSVPTVQGPFFTAMLYGMRDEAKKLGYTLEIRDAGGYANVDQQASQFENLAVQGVKAILIDPADAQTLAGSLAQAKSSNIPVIGAGDPFPGADTAVTASHCNVGKSMAEGAKKLLPEGGTMAALTGPACAAWTTPRWDCFKKDIAGSGIKIVSEKSSEPAVEQGVTIASDFLQRYPDVDLLYGADDTVGVGAAQAVQEAKKCDSTQVLTAVFGRQAEKLMKAGCIDYIAALPTVEIGRRAVREADNLIKGGKPESDTIEIPLVPVTKDNVDSVDISALREPDGAS
jgi:ribose transport system substrate-binding protein